MRTHMATEDYLEAILIISQKKGEVRSVDIADRLQVKKPSVTYITKKLREQSLIVMDKEGRITLTDAGFAIADRIYMRHRFLTALFMNLGVSEEVAREDACKIEHDLSETSFEAVRRYILENGTGDYPE